MAQLNYTFDATQVDPSQGAGQLPVSDDQGHKVIIVDSEIKSTKDETGGYLELTLSVVEGQAQGATGAYRLNLFNANQQAVEIAHRQLSAICHAIGVFQVQDSSQLHNQPFRVIVGKQKGSEEYTEVKRVLDVNGNKPGANKSNAPAQPQPQPQAQTPAPSQPAPQGGQQQPQWGQPQSQPQQANNNGQQAPWGGGQQQPAQPQQQNWQQGNQQSTPPWGNQG